jgi:hypothetical protein
MHFEFVLTANSLYGIAAQGRYENFSAAATLFQINKYITVRRKKQAFFISKKIKVFGFYPVADIYYHINGPFRLFRERRTRRSFYANPSKKDSTR